MSKTILSMKNICKSYNGFKALDNVSIEINRGDIYGIVGNNGAGKTTLMRLISGQSYCDSGEIRLFGSSDDILKERKRIGCLIENPGFFHNMTVYDNLNYFRIQFGIPGKQSINRVLEEVGLVAARNKKYRQLSLGMKQRLGIALAFLHCPEFLILDEPINGLDPEGIIEIRNILLNLNKKHNTTILISSHILSEMAYLVTKYAFIKKGKIVEEISDYELQQKCNNYLDIEVDNVNAMSVILEKKLNFSNYKVYPDNHIHLFEGIDESKRICEIAVANDIGILGIVKRKVNLENYYMDMMGEE